MVNTGLTEENVTVSVRILNGLLADHFTLMLKVWQFHWNVVGKSFGSYHQGMKDLYDAEFERVDEVAERIRALGGRPLGSMEAILSANHIAEFGMESPAPTAIDMWRIISADWDTMVRNLRAIHEQISPNDLATLNMLEDMITNMEKEAWMLRAYNEE